MSQSPIVDRIRLIPRPEDFLNRNIGSSGELYYSKTAKTLRVYDGTIRSGFEVVTEDNIRRNAASQQVATVKYTVTIGDSEINVGKNTFILNGDKQPEIDWVVGYTYYFDQSDTTNLFYPNLPGPIFNTHPLEFSGDDAEGASGAGTVYTKNVIYLIDYQPVTRQQYLNQFSAADHRAVQITITSDTPETLYYYCPTHEGEGNTGTRIYPGGGGGSIVAPPSSGASLEVSDTAPTEPANGDLWFQSTTGRLLVYIEDIDGAQWVQPSSVTPDLPDVVVDYADIINKPTFATVALSGDYNDLINTPVLSIPTTLTDLGITDGTAGQVLTTDGAGTFTFEDTQPGIDLTAFSVVKNPAAGSGDLAYDNATGVFTYTPPAGGGGGTSYDQSLNTTDPVQFVSVTAGDFITSGTSAPTIETASSLTITTTDGLIVEGTGPFRLPRMATADRNAIAAIDGDVIYNTTVNRVQVRQNGAWINLDNGSAA